MFGSFVVFQSVSWSSRSSKAFPLSQSSRGFLGTRQCDAAFSERRFFDRSSIIYCIPVHTVENQVTAALRAICDAEGTSLSPLRLGSFHIRLYILYIYKYIHMKCVYTYDEM